jgi:hypothetical protein
MYSPIETPSIVTNTRDNIKTIKMNTVFLRFLGTFVHEVYHCSTLLDCC